MYEDDQINELYEKWQGKLFSSKEELLRLITGNYIINEELHLRPLSKLIKDISEQLGFI